MLANTFEDPLNDSLWSLYDSNSAVASVSGGVATFTLQTSAYSNAELTSRHHHDLRGGAIAIDSTHTLAGPSFANFWLGPDSNHNVRFLLQAGQLRPSYELGGSGLDMDSIPYDPVAHRWWRIREEGGVVYWEASPDNADYTVLAERLVTALFPMDNVRMRIRAYANGTTPAAAQTTTVNEIVVTGPGTGAWCPIDGIADDFESDNRSTEWLLTGGTDGTGAVQTAGQVFLNLLPTGESDYQYISSKNYDLTEGQVSVELVTHGEGSASFLELTRTGQTITLQVIDVPDMTGDGMVTEVQAITNVEGDIQPRGTVTYDPEQHRFLRIRHDGTGLIWDSSADGITWPESPADPGHIATVSPTPMGLEIDAFDVRFGARADAMADFPGQSKFDNLNVLPTE
jgi:hypothetical protein